MPDFKITQNYTGVVLSSFGTHTETDPVTGEVIVTDRDQHSVMVCSLQREDGGDIQLI